MCILWMLHYLDAIPEQLPRLFSSHYLTSSGDGTPVAGTQQALALTQQVAAFDTAVATRPVHQQSHGAPTTNSNSSVEPRVKLLGWARMLQNGRLRWAEEEYLLQHINLFTPPTLVTSQGPRSPRCAASVDAWCNYLAVEPFWNKR